MADSKVNVSIEQLEEWKKEYKHLFKTTLTDGTVIIWRRLKRSEYKELVRKFDEIEDQDDRIWGREEDLARLCVLYPSKEELEDILEYQAGVASVLSDNIYANSGFSVKDRAEDVK
jgi:hypothetical protein